MGGYNDLSLRWALPDIRMKSIDILKHIVNRPGVFKTPWQREKARFHLHEKMKRRDRKLMKLQQLKIEI